MTDYSRLDEITLRKMLDSSSDLDERQQLRSVLRRLKKHANTIHCSPTNYENIMSKNQNNALSSFTSRWEQTNGHLKSSSSPNSNEILPRLEENILSHIANCNEVLENNSTGVNSNGKAERGVLEVIRNSSRSQDSGVVDVNRNCSTMSDGNIIHRPVAENCKQTLGKALSDSQLAQSRLLIQQMLAPKIAAVANPRNVQETIPPTMTHVPWTSTAANQRNAQETAPPITTLAPQMLTAANQGHAQVTTPPITALEPQVTATANHGRAQETASPTTPLSVQDDHSKSSDMLDSREHPPPPSVVDNDMPVFTRPLCDIPGATRGETVVLVCKVVARLQPMVLWYRNSQLVPVFSQRYEQSYDGDVAQLTIHSVSYDVVGVYECSARNAYGKVTSACRLQLTDNAERQELSMTAPPTPKVTIRRSETLPSSTLAMRIISSAARRKMEAEKSSLREDTAKINNTGVEVVSRPEEVEEEAVARSTRTEKASDGGKVTTTTTVTTHKTKDGAHLVTKQTKQITRVGGVGTTNYSINKCSAEDIAERLAGIFEKKALCGTGGVIVVKTENWSSQDGITHRNEKSQIWEAPRLALSFNEADMGSRYGDAPLQRSATTVKQRLLEWCRVTLKQYKHLNISNFSTSWNDGMAFCALVHHFIPDAFDYDQLEPKNRRENFQLAFETAEKRAGIVPLLDVEDMVAMTVPDWKCVFMYVQSIYREFVLPKPLQQRSVNNVDQQGN